jgi:hypothetical protein
MKPSDEVSGTHKPRGPRPSRSLVMSTELVRDSRNGATCNVDLVNDILGMAPGPEHMRIPCGQRDATLNDEPVGVRRRWLPGHGAFETSAPASTKCQPGVR